MSKKRISKKAARRKRWITGFFAVLFTIAGIVLSLTVFFKITDVKVKGELMMHTEQEILNAADIAIGSNLFRFNAKAKEKYIWETLAYVENVNIKRKLPGTVVIEIEETRKVFAIDHAGQYVVVSDNLKILNITDNFPVNAAKLIGISAIDPVKGKALIYETTENTACFFELVDLLHTYNLLSGVSEIDISDKLNYMMVYENRIRIMIGTANNLELKVKKIQVMLTEEIGADEQGYLDVSYTKRIIFKRGDISDGTYETDDSEDSAENGDTGDDAAGDGAESGDTETDNGID